MEATRDDRADRHPPWDLRCEVEEVERRRHQRQGEQDGDPTPPRPHQVRALGFAGVMDDPDLVADAADAAGLQVEHAAADAGRDHRPRRQPVAAVMRAVDDIAVPDFIPPGLFAGDHCRPERHLASLVQLAGHFGPAADAHEAHGTETAGEKGVQADPEQPGLAVACRRRGSHVDQVIQHPPPADCLSGRDVEHPVAADAVDHGMAARTQAHPVVVHFQQLHAVGGTGAADVVGMGGTDDA